MNKVAFHTFGCKLNFSETSTIARIFKEKGYKTTTIKSKRDINSRKNAKDRICYGKKIAR